MARTVVAIYDSFQRANDAVRELIDHGFPKDSISIIAHNAANGGSRIYNQGVTGAARNNQAIEDEDMAEETGAGAGVGAGIGAAIGGIGGLLIGLGALVIPGIGPVIAAGPLAVALSTLTGAGVGAVAGGVTGGLLGALIGLGVPEEEAEFYTEGVRRGGVLVTVQAEELNTDQIMTILNRHDPMDINEKVTMWRAEGWTGHDPAAQTIPVRSQPVNTGVWDTAEHNADFDLNNPVYRNHYLTFLAPNGYPYDYYVPAYRYGYGLAADSRYKNQNWSMIENDIRRDWEVEHPNTWERFKTAIRHAWEDAIERNPS